MNQPLLEGEVAVVTGAAQGIGEAIAARLAAEGATVVVADVDEDNGRETVADIDAEGGEARFVRTDVASAEDVHSLIDATVEAFDGLDILVNNAGGSFDDDRPHLVSEETWEKNIDVNLKGAFLCSRVAIPPMVEGGGGAMVHMSSVNGIIGIGHTAYSTAKSAILALSRNIATQYGRQGIRSNAICPGSIETETRRKEFEESGGGPARDAWMDQYPLGRFGTPEDVANSVLYLVSDLGAFVTGTALVVDGGLTAGLPNSFEELIYDIDEVPTR
jgi:3-oxoacyl-[acyl-carrier protein] reductase